MIVIICFRSKINIIVAICFEVINTINLKRFAVGYFLYTLYMPPLRSSTLTKVFEERRQIPVQQEHGVSHLFTLRQLVTLITISTQSSLLFHTVPAFAPNFLRTQTSREWDLRRRLDSTDPHGSYSPDILPPPLPSTTYFTFSNGVLAKFSRLDWKSFESLPNQPSLFTTIINEVLDCFQYMFSHNLFFFEGGGEFLTPMLIKKSNLFNIRTYVS